jgi:hypothetical protein
MNFKLKENGLIWENYANIPSIQKRQNYSDESEEKEEHGLDVEKSDLNDDGELSEYEQARGSAVANAMGDDSEDAEHFHGDEELDDVKNVVMSFDTSEPVKPEYKEEDLDEDDHERNEMIKSEIKKLCEFAKRLENMVCDANFEEWMAAKITKAADYTSDVYFRLSAKADYANGSHEHSEYEY